MSSPYDLAAERSRYAFPDVERGGVRLNRGTASPDLAERDPEGFAALRAAHRAGIVETTLDLDGPVIELDRPAAGIYVGSRRGVYLDLYQGVAQRLFDDERILPRLKPLLDSGLLARREINTDDYIGFAPEGVHLPHELAGLVTGEMARAAPRAGGYLAFFSNSGAESVEAGLKAVTLAAYRRVLERHGAERWAAVCAELGVAVDPSFGDHERPVWADYPLFVLALRGAFHGRTLGALSLTKSRAVQREGFPTLRWVRHVDPNDAESVAAMLDTRPLDDLLAEPGALASTVAAGRVPLDLLAGAVFEPFQGEGGYRMPALATLRALREACDRAGGLLVADEVQTFARTGDTFLSVGRGISPDVVCLAKAAVVGVTLVPSDVAGTFPAGWHSNTFGSGKLFDVNYSHAVIDTFLNDREPLFGDSPSQRTSQ